MFARLLRIEPLLDSIESRWLAQDFPSFKRALDASSMISQLLFSFVEYSRFALYLVASTIKLWKVWQSGAVKPEFLACILPRPLWYVPLVAVVSVLVEDGGLNCCLNFFKSRWRVTEDEDSGTYWQIEGCSIIDTNPRIDIWLVGTLQGRLFSAARLGGSRRIGIV